ncbi:putative cyclic nucleotide-gated ion channel 9 [Hordeum vulgare]|uniref:Cyclic nucleotide-binding domain-containing protein n=1 Tax=Hordeum vulgare subsp. vulgare TaxID=112509 RepID=A0A8I6WN37_HORVV|nr:probable cyclic nucleotide-gated ion channel 5 [Hordeum vulgare subsp. vulgare]KAE8767610.1 putative cyclic nucleotide-gated ion channel 9 [Hordeum vulgare]
MFSSCGGGPRSPFIDDDGRKGKFVRLEETVSPRIGAMDVPGSGHQMDTYFSRPKIRSRSIRMAAAGVMNRSERLKNFGRVFQEDLKNISLKIYDPQDPFLMRMNRLFVFSCIIAVAVDPMFFYLPSVTETEYNTCIGFNRILAVGATAVRSAIDFFYLARIMLQFHTAFIAPSSRVFGRGELVINNREIAHRYLHRFFIVDLLSVLPLPQIQMIKFFLRPKGSDLLPIKTALFFIVLTQYLPRLVRFYPIISELKRTTGVFAETAFAGAAFYLLLYMLASHMVGAFWYLLAVERVDDCWREKCAGLKFDQCIKFMYCGGAGATKDGNFSGFMEWRTMIRQVLKQECAPMDNSGTGFNYGIYSNAITSGVTHTQDLIPKILFCLWWGLQNLSTGAQGLETTHYKGEALFAIILALFGLILMALLIGNMQTYLQSMTLRMEEMRLKRRDSEQWMRHRHLPDDLRERVWRHNQYKWMETRGVDEDGLVSCLPKDIRRDVKRHLCLRLVRRVPLFANMDERLLDAICERLKPSLCTESTYVVREGDPVDEMFFIIRGRLESSTTDDGRIGFFNKGLLKEGDFCGEELLTWALDKAAANLPLSTRTVKAISEVEGFALHADELKFVAGQFRRLHSKQLQQTFRFYSQQWRTWASCFIQAAWRRYQKRKRLEQRRREVEQMYGSAMASTSSSNQIKTTFLVSRFAKKAMRNVLRQRLLQEESLILLPKPPEPDFGRINY